jgi:hypothetical protein
MQEPFSKDADRQLTYWGRARIATLLVSFAGRVSEECEPLINNLVNRIVKLVFARYICKINTRCVNLQVSPKEALQRLCFYGVSYFSTNLFLMDLKSFYECHLARIWHGEKKTPTRSY